MQDFHLCMQRFFLWISLRPDFSITGIAVEVLMVANDRGTECCCWIVVNLWIVVAGCGSLWLVVGRCGWFWVVVARCGSLWGRCWSLWGHCGSFHVLVTTIRRSVLYLMSIK